MKILVVEDEASIAEVLKQGLEEAGFLVYLAPDGTSELKMVLEGTYALVILDVMLPGIDGWSICEEVRRRRDPTPILMLTARDAVQDRVRSLELGADDYLPKPFEFAELLAGVRALLRHDKIHKARVIRVADLEVDTGAHRVTRAGQEIALTPREYFLLEALAGHQGRVLSREVILARVWMDEESFSNTVDVYIGLLRKKIDSGRQVRLIHTVLGLGYAIKAPDRGSNL